MVKHRHGVEVTLSLGYAVRFLLILGRGLGLLPTVLREPYGVGIRSVLATCSSSALTLSLSLLQSLNPETFLRLGNFPPKSPNNRPGHLLPEGDGRKTAKKTSKKTSSHRFISRLSPIKACLVGSKPFKSVPTSLSTGNVNFLL